MTLSEVKKLVWNQWSKEGADRHLTQGVWPDQRRSHLYQLETEYGIKLTLSPDDSSILSYKVLDEQKFMVFVLKWS